MDGIGWQKGVVEVVRRRVVLQPVVVLRVSAVGYISYEVHELADYAVPSFITQSSWLLHGMSCFKWDLLSFHCIASLDTSSLLILWPCCLWRISHILSCLPMNMWCVEYGSYSCVVMCLSSNQTVDMCCRFACAIGTECTERSWRWECVPRVMERMVPIVGWWSWAWEDLGRVNVLKGCLGSGGMRGIDGKVYSQQTCCECYPMNQLRICTQWVDVWSVVRLHVRSS